jgi:hypothetical protein
LADLYQPTPAILRDTLLADLRLAAIDTGVDEPPTQPGSDWYLLAVAMGNVGLLAFSNINSAEASANALDATGEDLERIREADGLSEVAKSGSSGKLKITVLGATTLTSGTQYTLPNGLRGEVVGTFINPADGDEVDVQSIDVGSSTNLAAPGIVRFVSAPVNIATEATVSTAFPLTGGTDEESDGRKRDRILNARRNRPGGGNWAQLRGWALDALAGLQDAYVCPALGGPGSCKVVLVRRFDVEIGDYSRALNDAETQAVRSYIQSKMPIPQEIVIQTVADEDLDVSLQVTLPASALAGGNGQGWSDPSPWPPLVTADAGSVTISSVATTNDQITVTAQTTDTPPDGQTHVAWWSSVDRKFQTRLVISVSGSSGAWVLTLDAPLIGDTGDGPQTGDFISPGAYNLDAYGAAWVALLERFGPGENTDEAARLERALRHPFTTDEDPTDVTNTTLARWSNGFPASGDLPAHPGFPEVSGFELAFANKTAPTVPATVDLPPNVLRPRHFAIYEL